MIRLLNNVRALLGQHERIQAAQAVRVAEPMPPRPQFADLGQTARYQARRRAFNDAAEADRLAAQIVTVCAGDEAEAWARRGAFVDRLDAAIAAELRRDVAADVRRAAE